MRHRAAVLTVVLLAGALALTGCSSDPDPAGEASPSPSAVPIGTDGPFPEVTGGFGEAPTLTFPDAEPSAGLQAVVLAEGDGAVVEAGDLMVVEYLGQIWDGEVFDNSYERVAPTAFPIGTGSVAQGWDLGLVGRTTGSRVLLSVPPDLAYGPQGNAQAGIAGTDTIVFVVDIVGSYARDAAGSPDAVVTAEASQVGPVVEGDLGTPASVSVPAAVPEPTEATTTVLAAAGGEPAQPGRLVLQYAATNWDNSDGESTWEIGSPASTTIGGTTPNVFDSLIGVPIGSRVLLELPAQGDIPAIAVVVDILGQISLA